MLVDISKIVLVVFAVSALVQVAYYLGIFSRFAFRKSENIVQSNKNIPVSVIICAKNEAQNLQKNLPLFFAQQYPNFEVVVVNDCSLDESEDILDEFEKKYTNLHVVNLKEETIKEHDKKLALTLGIKGAKNELLLLTDADCTPASINWIQMMVDGFDNDTAIILGFGAFKKTGGFLNKLIRFDAFMVALQYFSFSLANQTYMGIGRNLAYRKSLFFKHRGFASHYHIQSGDDDLFINRAATKTNTKIAFHPDSFTLTDPKKTYKTWIRQKQRHITTAKYYKPLHKIMLSLFSGSTLFFYAAFISLVFLPADKPVYFTIFIARMLSQLIVFRFSMIKLGQKDLWWMCFLFEVLLMFFYPFIFASNLFIKKHKWK